MNKREQNWRKKKRIEVQWEKKRDGEQQEGEDEEETEE